MNGFETEHITFFSDGLRLSGVLHLPGKRISPLVIGCHGLLSDKESKKQILMAKALNRAGIAYFRFDHRGRGSSEGDFETETSLDKRTRDLASSIELLKKRFSMGLGLFGSSMGGAVCLNYAANKNVGAVATLAAPVRIPTTPGEQALHNHPPVINEKFVREALAFDIADRVKGVLNVYLVHGKEDEVVPCSHALEIFQGAAPVKKLSILGGVDHRVSDKKRLLDVVERIAGWFYDMLAR